LILIHPQETPASNRPSHGKAKETQHVHFRNFVLNTEHAECPLQTLHISRLSELKTDEGTILKTNIFGSFRPFRNTSGKGEYRVRCVCVPVSRMGRRGLTVELDLLAFKHVNFEPDMVDHMVENVFDETIWLTID
jgi:hypothetical protein